MTYNNEEVDYLVKDFNEFIETRFNECIFQEDFDEYDEENFDEDEECNEFDDIDDIDEQSEMFIAEWENRKVSKLGDITPSEYINRLSTVEDAMKFFRYFSINSIDKNPPSIVKKIYSFGTDGVELFAQLLGNSVIEKDISNFDVLSDEEICEINIINSILKGIELMGEESASIWSDVLEFMNKCHENNELFLESGQKALGKMGKDVLINVAKHIDNIDVITNREEYMLLAISSIGYKDGSDEIYSCLRDSFKRMDNKVVGSIILSDYGDGRAVTVLRRYAKDNSESLDDGDYYSILASIENLGGQVDDLMQNRNIRF